MAIRLHPKRTPRSQSNRQAEALLRIKEHVEMTGKFPTKNWIARAMGFRNPQSSRDMLEALVIRGWINRVAETRSGKNYGWRYELINEKELS